MEEITFKIDENEWEVAQFIHQRGGIMNEFDNLKFSIFIDFDKPRVRFKNGDTILFSNGEFKIR